MTTAIIQNNFKNKKLGDPSSFTVCCHRKQWHENVSLNLSISKNKKCSPPPVTTTNPTCWCSSLLRLRANWSWDSSSISSATGTGTGLTGWVGRGTREEITISIWSTKGWIMLGKTDTTLHAIIKVSQSGRVKGSNLLPFPDATPGKCLTWSHTTELRGEI